MHEPRTNLAALDALILCGGLGTRLKSVVEDRPKVLALVQGHPFIDILLDELIFHGLTRFILCTGYMGEQIVSHIEHRKDAVYKFSPETTPLGTGGAILNALPLVTSDPFLVLNGDSFCRVNFAGILKFHQALDAAITLVAAPRGERCDAGTLQIDEHGRLQSFKEKAGLGDRINAGIYLINRAYTEGWSTDIPLSLERDVMPAMTARAPCYAFNAEGEVHDIGTPERYQGAKLHPPWTK